MLQLGVTAITVEKYREPGQSVHIVLEGGPRERNMSAPCCRDGPSKHRTVLYIEVGIALREMFSVPHETLVPDPKYAHE